MDVQIATEAARPLKKHIPRWKFCGGVMKSAGRTPCVDAAKTLPAIQKVLEGAA